MALLLLESNSLAIILTALTCMKGSSHSVYLGASNFKQFIIFTLFRLFILVSYVGIVPTTRGSGGTCYLVTPSMGFGIPMVVEELWGNCCGGYMEYGLYGGK